MVNEIPILGKKVVVCKNDGFRKFGILKSINQQFLVLVFDNGKEEYIPVLSVSSISIDQKTGDTYHSNFYDDEYQYNRTKAFERDAFCCQICGKDCEDKRNRGSGSSGTLECHHVERNLPKDKLNLVGNLISVCLTCHDKLTKQEHKGVFGQAAIDAVQLPMEDQD